MSKDKREASLRDASRCLFSIQLGSSIIATKERRRQKERRQMGTIRRRPPFVAINWFLPHLILKCFGRMGPSPIEFPTFPRVVVASSYGRPRLRVNSGRPWLNRSDVRTDGTVSRRSKSRRRSGNKQFERASLFSSAYPVAQFSALAPVF